MQLSRNNSWLFSPSNMSPASFALKPCGCCFLFTFTHCFSLFFLSSLSALCSFLFTSFYKLLQAVLFTHSDSSGHLFIFYFCQFHCWNTTPIPRNAHIRKLKKPPVGRRKWKQLCSWLYSFSKSCFSFILTYVLSHNAVRSALKVIHTAFFFAFIFFF